MDIISPIDPATIKPVSKLCGINAVMDRWLAARQDPSLMAARTGIVSRPFTTAERAERDQRLRERGRPGARPAFVYRRKRPQDASVVPLPPPPASDAPQAAPAPQKRHRRKPRQRPKRRQPRTPDLGDIVRRYLGI